MYGLGLRLSVLLYFVKFFFHGLCLFFFSIDSMGFDFGNPSHGGKLFDPLLVLRVVVG